MPLPRLPPEIVDTVINHLRDDKRALSACSLTCKQLLPSSRFHLFEKMTIAPHRIKSTLHFFESASTDIAATVRRLVIDDFSQWALDDEEGTRLAIPDYEFRRLLLLLHRVEHLRISNSYHVITARLLSALINVRELEMDNLTLLKAEHALQFVYAFPLLQRLSIVDSQWKFEPWFSTKYNKRPGQSSFSLGTLRLYLKPFSSIAKWLLSLDPVPSIHTLCRHAYEFDTPRSDTALLQMIGPCIHTLELKFYNGYRNGTCYTDYYGPLYLTNIFII
jgi:hypothetical protein